MVKVSSQHIIKIGNVFLIANLIKGYLKNIMRAYYFH